MDGWQHKADKLVEQEMDAGSVTDGKHIGSSNSIDELAESFASDGDSQSSDDEEDEEEGSIFVAEEAYAPLDDADEDSSDSQDGATRANIDDAFQCRDAANSATTVADAAITNFDKQIPFDFEQELDGRIEAELAAKQSLEANVVSSQEPRDASTPLSLAPIEVVVGRSGKMSDEHIGQIKSIMAGIQLSDAAIPEWSRRVPEGSWMPRRRTVSSVHRPLILEKVSGSPIDSDL
ncbi:hypothetical protein GGH94_001895 [Coemansia aciculifera]|uniref:Uncharacterized protein n=1 Tax=Coemansia aciculifera TaxID=417176 RepID=A0A9W8M6I2_9FUNG|nr:hypothetical protein GGH94_001895 [Coemansia aciculifera]